MKGLVGGPLLMGGLGPGPPGPPLNPALQTVSNNDRQEWKGSKRSANNHQ